MYTVSILIQHRSQNEFWGNSLINVNLTYDEELSFPITLPESLASGRFKADEVFMISEMLE